jgi:hypothetical protein
MSSPMTGGCLCGAVRYEITAPVTTLRACHCRNCQKSSGSGGTVNAVVQESDFRITQGTTKSYDDSATRSGRTLSRHFCGACGSPIYSHRNPKPGFLVVRAGSLDESGGLKITAHIWTSTRRPWSHIEAGTECHPENFPAPPPAR